MYHLDLIGAFVFKSACFIVNILIKKRGKYKSGVVSEASQDLKSTFVSSVFFFLF